MAIEDREMRMEKRWGLQVGESGETMMGALVGGISPLWIHHILARYPTTNHHSKHLVKRGPARPCAWPTHESRRSSPVALAGCHPIPQAAAAAAAAAAPASKEGKTARGAGWSLAVVQLETMASRGGG